LKSRGIDVLLEEARKEAPFEVGGKFKEDS